MADSTAVYVVKLTAFNAKVNGTLVATGDLTNATVLSDWVLADSTGPTMSFSYSQPQSFSTVASVSVGLGSTDSLVVEQSNLCSTSWLGTNAGPGPGEPAFEFGGYMELQQKLMCAN